MNIIPGVQQDHTGFEYQLGIDDQGAQHKIPYIQETPTAIRGMTKVQVPSKSSLVLGDPDNNEATERKLIAGNLFKRGESFESFEFFQGSSV